MATPTEPIRIVRLDAIYAPDPTFPNILHTYVSHQLTSADETASRLANATVAITTTVRITRSVLEACPSLKLIAVLAIGTDCVDLETCKEKGVMVCNVPAASNESVAEHAIGLYFALRRKVVWLHGLMTGEGEAWRERGSLKGEFGVELPGTCREEVLGVVGVGELGNRVANIAKALGMTVLFSDRKGLPSSSVRPGRTAFEEVLKTSTVLMIAIPLLPLTRNLISTPELSLMRSDAIIVNVARGGIVDEEALVKALREGKVAGAAADVFLEEPATKENSPLVRAASEVGLEGKLVLSPHVAWCARISIEKLRGTVKGNVEGWVRGEPQNLVQ